MDIYDASTNTWANTSTGEAANGRTAAVLNNKVFFAGGFKTNVIKTVDIYDLGTNTWSTAQLSEGREGLSAATAGGKIYFAGGLNGSFSS